MDIAFFFESFWVWLSFFLTLSFNFRESVCFFFQDLLVKGNLLPQFLVYLFAGKLS